MKRHVITLALGAALISPAAQADVELMGKAVQVYGKLHLSYDLYDRGATTAAVTDPSGTEVASNSSRLGFKGEVGLSDALKAVWKFESEIDLTGEVGTLKARNRYLGVDGSWGTVLLGIHDTPLKSLAGEYTLFGDTVGDRRGILGQTSDGKNLFNVRAKNMLMYRYKGAGFTAALMHANDFENVTDPDQSKNQLFGASLGWRSGPIKAGVAYEKQSDIGGTAGADASAYRVGASYDFGQFAIGGIYESMSNDGFGARVERSAYGLNGSLKLGKSMKLALQYLTADASAAGNDGASEASVGAFYKINKMTEVYLMYATLSNDPGASYRLARSGHGVSFNPTAAGERVNAASVGMSLKF